MVTTYDVRWACDVLRPVYDATDGVDGRVSIEVDPRLAHETERDGRRGAPAVVAGRPAQPVHQDPGHQGRPAGDRAVPGRGHQRQRHADLLPRALRRGDGRLPRRHRAGPGGRPRPLPARVGRLVLRQPRRHRGRQAARQDRVGGGEGDCAGKAAIANARLAYQRYEEVFGDRALGVAGRRRRPAAAPAVGVDRRQGPGVRRHAVRRRAGRPGSRQHHARGDPGRGRRPRRDPRRHDPG